MSSLDSEILKYLMAIGLLILGALAKHLFDRVAVERGWTREDKRAQDGKIERVDTHARAEVARIERELGDRVVITERDIAILNERVENMPTADDMQVLDRRLSDVDRGLSGVISKVDGMNVTVKTILEHILASERRG